MTLEQYISELRKLTDSVDKLVDDFIKKNSGALLSSVKLRFWNKGLDGNLQLIGTYAQSTIERKKKSSYSRTSHVTLRDSGQWYDDLFVVYEKGDIFLDNRQRALTAKLIDGEKHFQGYGEGIMEFTAEEKNNLVTAILTDLDKYLQKVFNTDIDITI